MSDQEAWYYAQDGVNVGPVTADDLRAQFRAGVLGPSTLTWHPDFGPEWRQLQHAGLGLETAPPISPQTSAPPPALPSPDVASASPARPTAAAPTESNAWSIAMLPLAAVVLGVVLDQISTQAGNAVNVASLITTLLIIRQDRKQMIAAGYARPPSAWWVLVTPVYLWKRANILGRSKAPFWVQLGTIALSIGIAVASAIYLVGLLGTAASCTLVQPDVVRLWNGIDTVKRANLVGEKLDDVTEVSQATGEDGIPRRTCRAVVVTKDGARRTVDYVVSTEDGKTYIRVTAR